MRREAAERLAQEALENEKPVDKMNVKELREKLVSLGINPDDSAKKADLIGLLESVLNIDSNTNEDSVKSESEQSNDSGESGESGDQKEEDQESTNDQTQEENKQPE